MKRNLLDALALLVLTKYSIADVSGNGVDSSYSVSPTNSLETAAGFDWVEQETGEIKANAIKIITGSPALKPTRAPTTTSPSTDESCTHATSWLLNTNGQYSNIYAATVDITTSGFVNSTAATTGWQTTFNGIPFYGHDFTSEEIANLNSRPKAATDFVTGQTTAVAGQYYDFGANIGYASSKCTNEYWPTGPDCPIAAVTSYTFPVWASPEASSGGCYVPLHLGYFVNGVAMWSWSDSDSYNDESVWWNAAMSFEVYDMDVCIGHSGSDTYHHHSYSPCLMTQLNDTGAGHSPVHGFAIDGYPVCGPYQAADTLAVSCWAKRDYSSAETGCSGGGRTCLLVDAYDITQGTTPASSAGPNPNGTTPTQSGNTISAASGAFFEDYFLDTDCTSSGLPQALDSHNGHSHAPYGYHYHVTMNSTGGPTFPYTVGPKFYGCHSGKCDVEPYGAEDSTSNSVCTVPQTQKPGACTEYISSPAISYPTMSPTAPLISRYPTLHPTRTPSAVPTASLKPTRKPSKAPSAAAAASVEVQEVEVEEVPQTEESVVATVSEVVGELLVKARRLLRGFVAV